MPDAARTPSRRTLPTWLGAAALGATLSAALAAPASAQAPPDAARTLRAAADAFHAPPAAGGGPRRPWPDLGDSTRAAAAARLDRVRALLREVRPESLRTPADRLLHENLVEVTDASAGARICRLHLWAGTNQFGGWHVAASNAARVQPVGTDAARATALDAFRALPAAIRAEEALLRRGLDSGYAAARPVIATVVRQLDDLLPADPAQSPLHAPAERDSSAAFRREWAALLADVVYPAGRAYRDFLQHEYMPRARSDGALAGLPDGAACYAAWLRDRTSLRVDVDSVMTDARREVDRLRAELTPLALSLTGERDVGRAIVLLRTDPRFTFAHRDSVLPAYRAMTRRAAERVDRVVAGVAPESLVVVAYPLFQERAGLPPQYLRASDDGARPAQFLVNLSRTERMAVANAVAHEAYPGHHLQRVAATRADVAHPAMRTLSVGAFVEGWGIYSEALADEMGLYETELDRAGYLVHLLDTAMACWLDMAHHAHGWRRATLVDSMRVLGGRTRESAEAYADRHAGTPGQLATYYVGWRAIADARRAAEARLGAAFRSPEFHREVLRDGTVTLASLRRKLGEWEGVPPGR